MTNEQVAAHFASLPPDQEASVRVYNPDSSEVQLTDFLWLDKEEHANCEHLDGEVAVYAR